VARIYWRPMGPGPFKSKPIRPLSRGVYAVHLSPAELGHKSFEYYIDLSAGTDRLRYPVGGQNQTVLLW
jgi:hypothetical protein